MGTLHDFTATDKKYGYFWVGVFLLLLIVLNFILLHYIKVFDLKLLGGILDQKIDKED